jgi:hypothetical protein
MLLNGSWFDQLVLVVFLFVEVFMAYKNIQVEWAHQCLIVLVAVASVCAMVLEYDSWIIR